MRRRGQRGSRAWRDALDRSAIAPVLAAERHYLQFDGVGDYAVADAVFGGISGDYTVAIKVASPVSSGGAGTSWRYLSTGGPGTSVTAQSDYDGIRRSATRKARAIGVVPSSGSSNYLLAASGELSAEKTVLAVRRTAAGGVDGVQFRCVNSGGVVYSVNQSCTMYKPDHLCIGAAVDDTLSTVASTFANVSAIGVLLASAIVSDAELIAWLAAETAEGVVSNIDHYWAASDLSGSTIPARVGTVALTVSGPTISDLVAL